MTLLLTLVAAQTALLGAVLAAVIINNKQNRKTMTAIKTINASIANATSAIDSAVTELQVPHATDAQVLAAASLLDAQTARLNGAVAAAQNLPPQPAS